MYFKNIVISLLIRSCFLKTVPFQRVGGRNYLECDQKRRAKVVTGPEMTFGTSFCPAPKKGMAKHARETAPPDGNGFFHLPGDVFRPRLSIHRARGRFLLLLGEKAGLREDVKSIRC
jgi:hypothetical protein